MHKAWDGNVMRNELLLYRAAIRERQTTGEY